MSAKIIDGKLLAEKIKDQVVNEIIKLNGKNQGCPRRPNLAIILIGKRPDSELYVSLKEREAKKVGIDTHLYKCPKNISEKEVLEIIDCLNQDDMIDAILIQLPLPEKLNTEKIIKNIDPEKDVDRFHPDNLRKLMASCKHDDVLPPVHATIFEILKSINFNLEKKKIVLVVNSNVFGDALKKILECRGADAEIVFPDDKILSEKTRSADVLVTAVGKPDLIFGNMIKKGAVIVDIGISKNGKKISGDVNFNEAKKIAGYITPVPGGVGPMTIAMLFRNTLELYKKRKK